MDTEPGLSDDELVARARAGNDAAFDTLVNRYQPLVYRFGLRMCGDADAAGDVLQDTLLSMTRSLPRFRGESSLSTWLYTVARRACLRQRRRRKFEPAAHDSVDALRSRDLATLTAAGMDPEQAVAERELREAMQAALASLKPADRAVIVLRDVQGLTAPEVARVLGISAAAVKSRLHRARLVVRERLEPASRLPRATAADRCPDVLRQLSRHLEGDLAVSACAEMMAHVERCPRCRAACDSLKRVLARCRDSVTPAPPPAVGAAVRDAIRIFLAARQSRGTGVSLQRR